MSFLKKIKWSVLRKFVTLKKKLERSKPRIFTTDDIFVVRTRIISSYKDANGCNGMGVAWYFLAVLENGKYHELFSGMRLREDNQIKEFDTPYINKVEPLHYYLKEPGKKVIKSQKLCKFITEMNVLNSTGALLELEDDAV